MSATPDPAGTAGRIQIVPVLGPVLALNLLAIGIGLWGDGAALAGWLVVLGVLGLFGTWATALLWRRSARRLERVTVDAVHSALPQQELELARAQGRAAELRLREVIDAIPAGLAIYDNQDRLIGYNQEVSRQFPYRGEGNVIGETYEALMRRSLAAGKIPDAVGREEEWLAVRLAGRGTLNKPLLRHTDDGHWVHFYENRTPSGYLVMTRLDMTPMVEKGLALERANDQLLRLSTTDGLTGIANRRLFDQTLQNEWQRCARTQSRLSMLMIDIDHFKRYNDHYGHPTGDECLRQVARVLGLCVKRSGEMVARFGGEEFAILLPGANAQEARQVAQRCLHEMLNARIPHADSPVSPWLSVSIGVATVVAAPGQSPANLVAAADSAMYRAKEAGRARLEVFEPAPADAAATGPAST